MGFRLLNNFRLECKFNRFFFGWIVIFSDFYCGLFMVLNRIVFVVLVIVRVFVGSGLLVVLIVVLFIRVCFSFSLRLFVWFR